MGRKRKVSFWATKTIKKPTTVKFRLSDGTLVNFKATKTIKKPIKGFRFGHEDGSEDDESRIAYIKPLMIVIFRNQKEEF